MLISGGYVLVINNTVLIQWGKLDYAGNIVTLPCSYTNSYVIQVSTYGWEYGCVYFDDSLTLSTFKPYNVWYKEDRTSNGFVMWMTIGS